MNENVLEEMVIEKREIEDSSFWIGAFLILSGIVTAVISAY